MKESGSSGRSCESRRRRGRPQTTRGVRKRCRIRAGWRHEWIPRTELPSRSVLAIRQVVRGPFSSPRLVSASPYVLVSSNCKNGGREACKSFEICPRIKRGIPDPWAEYLAYRGFCSKDDQRTVRRDLDLGCKNIYVTATVWKDLGLPLGQGIPDPWKTPASRRKWVTERGPKLHGDKHHQHEKPYGGCCKRSQAAPRSSSPRGNYRVDKAAVNINPALSNPPPQQETRCEEVRQQETVQRCADFTEKPPSSSPEYRSVKEAPKSAVPCNPKRDDRQPMDIVTKPRTFGTRPYAETPGRPSAKPEDDFKFKVQDAACMCDGGDFKKKRVGFETRNLPCTNRGGQTLNHNLNVTQLPCGCVHISPCNGMRGCLGSRIEGPGFRPGGGVAFPGDARHGGSGSLDQTHRGYPQSENKSYQDQKPKMMSRMKRLLSHCKPTRKSQHRTGKSQTVKSEVRLGQIPNDSKLVCCQCSCPYLKIENPPPGASSKTVEKKKKKCACGRCVAKRERREKRRSKNAAMEEQRAPFSPSSACRCVQVKSPDQRVKSDSRDVQVPKHEADVKKEEIYPPSAPAEDSTIVHENKGGYEAAENLSANVNSLDAWKSPAVFGAPWYSSESGENADVSEDSRHTIQCSAMLQASPETSLVTSCTFISRINDSMLLQCLKKRERRPKKGEVTREELDAESIVGRNCLPRSDQDSSSCKANCKTNGTQIPVLSIEKSEANDSQASLRPACIDPPMGFASFSKDEETSQTSSSSSRDKKRRNSFGKRANSGKRESAEENKLLRAHLTETILGETRNSTDVNNDGLKAPNPSRETQEVEDPAEPEVLCLYSCGRGMNFGYDTMITTIVSPRRISTNSSTTRSPDSRTRECRNGRAPANTTTGGSSSEDPRSSTGKHNAIVYRCEVPFTPGPYSFAKSSARSNKTKSGRDSTPRYGIGSAGKMDGFLEGEDLGRSYSSVTEETENENPRESVKKVRILVPNETRQGEKKGPADNKCYLKYCSSLQQSGPYVVSPSHKILRIQHPSCTENDNCEDSLPGMTVGKQFPLGRRMFSNSSSQMINPAALSSDDFRHVSPHP